MRTNKKVNTARVVNQCQIEYTRKPISSWGGVATLMAKFLETIGLREWVEENIPVVETSPNSMGVYSKILSQFLTVLCGGSRFAHLGWWGHGVEVIERCFGIKHIPRASSTLTRFWGRFDNQGTVETLLERLRIFCRELLGWAGVNSDVLALDSTVVTRYGQQEGAQKGYNPKKPGRPSHHPILAFLLSGYVVNLWNRRGDTHTGGNVIGFLKQTLKTLGPDFVLTRLLCDSGFYLREFLEFLERIQQGLEEEFKHLKGLTYVMAAPMTRTFQNTIHSFLNAKNRWTQVEDGIEVAEFTFKHQDPKWKTDHHYIVVRQDPIVRPKAAGKQPSLFEDDEAWKDYRFSLYVTNDPQTSPVELWREYRRRSNVENTIKELKEGYGLAAFNLHSFWATEAVMAINALLFHNLIHHFTRTVLYPGGNLPQLATIRARWLNVPALLGKNGRKDVVRLAVTDRSFRCKLDYRLHKIHDFGHRLKPQCS